MVHHRIDSKLMNYHEIVFNLCLACVHEKNGPYFIAKQLVVFEFNFIILIGQRNGSKEK